MPAEIIAAATIQTRIDAGAAVYVMRPHATGWHRVAATYVVGAVVVVETAHAPNAFALPVDDDAVGAIVVAGEPAAVERVDPRGRVVGFAAVSRSGGRNVYRYGETCRDCDRRYDPMRRAGVACAHAFFHAAFAVESWERHHGVGAGAVVPVREGEPVPA